MAEDRGYNYGCEWIWWIIIIIIIILIFFPGVFGGYGYRE